MIGKQEKTQWPFFGFPNRWIGWEIHPFRGSSFSLDMSPAAVQTRLCTTYDSQVLYHVMKFDMRPERPESNDAVGDFKVKLLLVLLGLLLVVIVPRKLKIGATKRQLMSIIIRIASNNYWGLLGYVGVVKQLTARLEGRNGTWQHSTDTSIMFCCSYHAKRFTSRVPFHCSFSEIK